MYNSRTPHVLFRRYFFGIFFLLWCSLSVSAQTELVIDSILISGNKKTKERILLREMTFGVGDTLPLLNINPVFDANRLRLMNTGLFAQVFFNIKSWDQQTGHGTISLQVEEAWYIFPVPTFELADRNFNVWWVDYDHSLDRVNYGFNLYYSNVTGRQDYLQVKTQIGFTRKFEIDYLYPYLNRDQTLGMSGGFLHTRNKAINFATLEDKQQFQGPFNDGPDLLRRTRARLGFRYRPGLFFLHALQASYHFNQIDSSVNQFLNPNFFLDRTRQRFLALEYELSYDSRDVIAYPTRGLFASFNIRKEGLGVWEDLNQLFLRAILRPYFPLNDRWSLGLTAEGRVAFNRSQQPFYNMRALGYETTYLRGYEYYVIDGLDYGFLKTDLRWNFLERPVDWGKLMPFQSLRKMSLQLYLNVFADVGYAHNPFYADGNELANRLLTGYGVGLDIVVYFNKVFQLQMSRNHLGELGYYFTWVLNM